MKKLRILLTFGLLAVLMLTVATSAFGGQEKVDVCHITGTHDFEDGQGEVKVGHIVSIADPAYDSHIAHGDPEVYTLRDLPNGSQVCTGGAAKRVFVTSADYQGDLGGLAGADAKCQELADIAELGGSYRAWLSTDGDGNSAAERLTHSPAPYVLVDGTVIANNWTDLITDKDPNANDKEGLYLRAPINLNENGVTVTGQTWTATRVDGMFSGSHCSSWTTADRGTDPPLEPANWGNRGSSSDVGHFWTYGYYTSCEQFSRLFCFEQ
ncbi:hypothetical protein ACFLWA_13145 [Chloroflexota bacterium]